MEPVNSALQSVVGRKSQMKQQVKSVTRGVALGVRSVCGVKVRHSSWTCGQKTEVSLSVSRSLAHGSHHQHCTACSLGRKL